MDLNSKTMQKNIFITTCSIALLFFSACEKPVNIDLPYEGNKIVINSLMMKDSFMYARLTNSSQLSSSSIFPVPAGAKIDLYENDVFKETLTRRNIWGKDYFVSVSKAIEGKKYTLKASAAGLDNAEGSDLIPHKPYFDGIEFKQTNSGSDQKAKLVININDPAGEKNYYRLRFYAADSNTSVTGPRFFINKQYYQYFKVDNLSSSSDFDVFGDYEYSQLYFTDDKFDGRNVSLTVNISYFSSSQQYIAPELVHLSRDSYRYLQSRENQFNNEGNPFTEAVVVYNNISGGYGIVGGMADSIKIVRKQ
jgi:hypothetical protein